MTYIPEFWAKRWKDSSYEYIQITNRKTDGFIHVPSRRIDRYRNRAKGMAMNASVSRTDARNAKPAPNMALFDVWSWSVLGILYLVEYASYDAKLALGYGGTSVTSTEMNNHKTGQCDSLGMSSGGTSNDKKHSVIYRGIEDFYGFKREWVDGISWDNDRYIYVCPDYKKYDRAITSDYMRLADKLTSNSVNGFVSRWGYDQNWPLVMTPSGYSFDTNPMYTGLDTRGPMSEGYYSAVTCGANSEYRATILSQSYPVDIDYSYVTHRYVQYDTTAI